MSKTQKMYLALFVLTLAFVMLLGSFAVFAVPPPVFTERADYGEVRIFVGNNALWTGSFDLRGWSTPQMRTQVSVERNYRVTFYGMETTVFTRVNRSSNSLHGTVNNLVHRGAAEPFPANENRSVHYTEAQMRSRIGAPNNHRVHRMEWSRTIGGAVSPTGRPNMGGWNFPTMNHPNH